MSAKDEKRRATGPVRFFGVLRVRNTPRMDSHAVIVPVSTKGDCLDVIIDAAGHEIPWADI